MFARRRVGGKVNLAKIAFTISNNPRQALDDILKALRAVFGMESVSKGMVKNVMQLLQNRCGGSRKTDGVSSREHARTLHYVRCGCGKRGPLALPSPFNIAIRSKCLGGHTSDRIGSD